MKMNELKLVYFSPTGATRKAVMETARSIDLKSVSFDFSVYKEKKPTLKFTRNDLAIFGIPVYYGRVPALFMEYLQLLELKTEVESRGFKVIGAAAFPAEHSIVPSIGSRRPNKTDLKAIAEFGVELNRRIRKEESFDHIDIKVPGNTPYKKYGKNSLFPKAESSMCTLCGACAKVCPTGAIPLKEPKKTDTKKCIGCMKCVRVCKQNARSVNSLKMKMLEGKLKKACQSDKKAEIFL